MRGDDDALGQVHGALGYSTDLPLEAMYRFARAARIYDGPDEVHRQSVARRILRGYQAPQDGVPSEHVPTRREAARARFADLLEAVTSPYEERPGLERYAEPAPEHFGAYTTFCGT